MAQPVCPTYPMISPARRTRLSWARCKAAQMRELVEISLRCVSLIFLFRSPLNADESTFPSDVALTAVPVAAPKSTYVLTLTSS